MDQLKIIKDFKQDNKENKNGIILATNYRGSFILNSNCWIYNMADNDYISCQFGNLDYFIKALDNDKDHILTASGFKVVETYKACKMGVGCCTCIAEHKAPSCYIASIVNELK